MFASHDRYKLPVPAGLTEPGAHHWRLIEVALRAPWFILSVNDLDGGVEAALAHTWCVAWEQDLANALVAMGPSSIRGLVCMVPQRSSANGQWASQEVAEVWIGESQGGHILHLRDALGASVDCGTVNPADRLTDMRLLWRLGAAEPAIG